MKFRHLQNEFNIENFGIQDFVTIKNYDENNKALKILKNNLIEKFTIEIRQIENEIKTFEKNISSLSKNQFSIQKKNRFNLILWKFFNRTHFFSIENIEQKHSGKVNFERLYKNFNNYFLRN